MQRELYKTKNIDKDKGLVNVIESGLVDSENKIEEMSPDEIENERLYDRVNTVKDILHVNNQNQKSQVNILTTDQMLSRLPITLASLKVGSYSEKLKNEIIHLLYSLYYSKKLIKKNL